MTVAQHIPAEIKRACKSIGYATWIDDAESYAGLSTVLQARLGLHQLTGLTFAALAALVAQDRDAALVVVDTATASGTGQPIAPLFNHMDEAAFWADLATPVELDAYCLASFNAMQPSRQAAFLDFVQERKAA